MFCYCQKYIVLTWMHLLNYLLSIPFEPIKRNPCNYQITFHLDGCKLLLFNIEFPLKIENVSLNHATDDVLRWTYHILEYQM